MINNTLSTPCRYRWDGPHFLASPLPIDVGALWSTSIGWPQQGIVLMSKYTFTLLVPSSSNIVIKSNPKLDEADWPTDIAIHVQYLRHSSSFWSWSAKKPWEVGRALNFLGPLTANLATIHDSYELYSLLIASKYPRSGFALGNGIFRLPARSILTLSGKLPRKSSIPSIISSHMRMIWL